MGGRNVCEKRQSGQVKTDVNRPTPGILVVLPLNSLVNNQLKKLNKSMGLKAAILKNCSEERDSNDSDEPGIKDGLFNIVFLHPKACLSSKAGLNLLQSAPYQTCVEAVVVDKAHCIFEW